MNIYIISYFKDKFGSKDFDFCPIQLSLSKENIENYGWPKNFSNSGSENNQLIDYWIIKPSKGSYGKGMIFFAILAIFQKLS